MVSLIAKLETAINEYQLSTGLVPECVCVEPENEHLIGHWVCGIPVVGKTNSNLRLTAYVSGDQFKVKGRGELYVSTLENIGELTITLPFPSARSKLNAHNKGHFRNKNKAIQNAKLHARIITSKRMKHRWVAATLEYHFVFPDRRGRDESNLIQTCKPYVDGVVKAGLIPDDNWKHLHVTGVKCSLSRSNPRMDLVFKKSDRTFELVREKK